MQEGCEVMHRADKASRRKSLHKILAKRGAALKDVT